MKRCTKPLLVATGHQATTKKAESLHCLSGCSHQVSSAARGWRPQTSDVISAPSGGRGLHLVLLVDRRHSKQEDVSWETQQKIKTLQRNLT